MIKDVDSLGNKLSPSQIKFFENSKIVNNNNELYFCYHGSGAEFKNFNQEINWFTIDKDYASEYSSFWGGKTNQRIYTVYLNCRNPFNCGDTNGSLYLPFPTRKVFSTNAKRIFDDLGLNNDEIENLIKDVVNEREKENYTDKKTSFKYEYTLKVHVLTRTKTFKKVVMSKGYDSIITDESGHMCFGVFKPNDIKLTSNLEPTSSQNINENSAKLNDIYSLREDNNMPEQDVIYDDEKVILKQIEKSTTGRDTDGNVIPGFCFTNIITNDFPALTDDDVVELAKKIDCKIFKTLANEHIESGIIIANKKCSIDTIKKDVSEMFGMDVDIVEVTDKFNESLNEDVPTKTGTAYKLFKVRNGKLYPPMVANSNGQDTPIGVWLDAQEGEFAGLSKTGRPQVKSTGSGKLAYRPGWHLGELPYAPQFELRKNPGYMSDPSFVWGECEYAMDTDYQKEADEQGYMRTKVDDKGNVETTRSDKYQHSLAGLKKLPNLGYYKYRTNPDPNTIPWVITGQIKVNRILSDEEVEKICQDNGVPYLKRPGGNKTLKELGLQENLQEDNQKVVDSEGNELSPKQIEFFKDSKVRDEKGNLLVVYHGTSNDFDIFSVEESWDYFGFHFGTEKAAKDRNSSKVGKYYLNAKNVFNIKEDLGDWDAYGFSKYFLSNPNEALNFMNDDELGYLRQEWEEWEYDGTADDDTSAWDAEFGEFIRGKLYESNYDCIKYTNEVEDIGSTSYMVFYPNQIKAITNKEPSNSDNINEMFGDDALLMVEKAEKHETLNPKLWNEDGTLKDEVREKIMEICDEFLDDLKEDDIKFKLDDIRLVGSNCSYNYNEHSDLDIHLIMDTDSLECPDDLYPLLYSAYRSIFNKKFEIDFYGIPVEIYVETM